VLLNQIFEEVSQLAVAWRAAGQRPELGAEGSLQAEGPRAHAGSEISLPIHSNAEARHT
jgi:hypothetical protein